MKTHRYGPPHHPNTLRIHQLFRIFSLPAFLFPPVPVFLVTVLRLHPQKHTSPTTYLIESQNDLYQVNRLSLAVYAWQVVATGFCVLGAGLFWWVSWVEQNVVGGMRREGWWRLSRGEWGVMACWLGKR